MFPHQFKKLIADLPLRRGDGHKTKFREQRMIWCNASEWGWRLDLLYQKISRSFGKNNSFSFCDLSFICTTNDFFIFWKIMKNKNCICYLLKTIFPNIFQNFSVHFQILFHVSDKKQNVKKKKLWIELDLSLAAEIWMRRVCTRTGLFLFRPTTAVNIFMGLMAPTAHTRSV